MTGVHNVGAYSCPMCGTTIPEDHGECPSCAWDGSVTLRDLQVETWQIAENHGWHELDRSRGDILALIHSEVSEALEAHRDGDDEEYAEELADIVIRVFDHAKSEGIDMHKEIARKNEKNRDREYRHGGKEL